jgi:3'5'-cyclic nucleotide phosphodiesterase
MPLLLANISFYRFVSAISSMYRENAFHNFEHASHVIMSVTKLLSRVASPNESEQEANKLYDHTYGITSDPLTRFACVFSALIHDVDHSGVPNIQLCQENVALAEFYKHRSVAEQNSVDLAWALLMQEDYVDLRRVIYRTEEEKQLFRQLVVNSVMATDIMDKELKELRNVRWTKAFSEEALTCTDIEQASQTDINRKATIVIEHLIQASDVVHTMQHWHIYRKWNERLFEEMYVAYEQDRANRSPADFWYEGELGFFDFYIIPLAKKLKDCGVFGASSDEYLNYAVKNREEWEAKGRQLVEEMHERVQNRDKPVASLAEG